MGNQGMVAKHNAEKQLENIKRDDFVIVTWKSPAVGTQTYFGFYEAAHYDAQKTGWINLQKKDKTLLGSILKPDKPILIDSSTSVQKIESGTKVRLTLDDKTMYGNQIKGNPIETAVSFIKKDGTPLIQFDYNGKKIAISAESVEQFEVVKNKPAEQDGFIRKKK